LLLGFIYGIVFTYHTRKGVILMHKIREIRKELLTNYGIDLSHEKINRWHENKIFDADINSKSNYKEFTDEQYIEFRNKALLMELGTPMNDIKTRNKLAIEKRIKVIRTVAPLLRVPKSVL
jgi:DNA-binding transcriptional MerR regulator